MSEPHTPRTVPLTRAGLPPTAWSVPVPIRFGRCDAAGIVYTPHYFDMFNEVAEQFFMEALRVDYYDLIRTRRIGLGYAQAACEFMKPSRMGERLDVVVMVERIGGSSYTLRHHALKDGTEVARGRFVTVTTSLETMASLPIPPDIRAALLAYRARCEAGAPGG